MLRIFLFFLFNVQKLCLHSHPLLGYKSVIQSGFSGFVYVYFPLRSDVSVK